MAADGERSDRQVETAGGAASGAAFVPKLAAPPRGINFAGRPRRVGVEIEFAGMSARGAALEVQALFGGAVKEIDPHSFRVAGTALGDFHTLLDMRYAHPQPVETRALGAPAGLLTGLRGSWREFIGDLGALVAPCEVVCPPVELADLPRLEFLPVALRRAGALGTESSLLYAFGLHLNPDIAADSADYVTAVLKAYLLLSDWLRAEISPDITRRLLPFADPFPASFVDLALAPDYWPDWRRLTEDYLRHNPTRNREFDLLPLLKWRDPERVEAAALANSIKPRPTFHYRLPDARLTAPDWTIAAEWNRWCRVEGLAEDRDRLARMARAYADNRRQMVPADWAAEAARWLDAG